MGEYTCKTKCTFRARVWRPGETLVANKGEIIPPHFIGGVPDAAIPKKDKITLHSIATEDARLAEHAILLKRTKDDLIVLAAKLGLSKDKDLVAIRKHEIVDLIIDKKYELVEPVEEKEEDIFG